jgi:hypothetical protein
LADAETAKPSAPAAKSKAPAAVPPPKAGAKKPTSTDDTPEQRLIRETAFTTTWYWVTFLISFVSFWILLIYFTGARQWYVVFPYWIAIVLAGGLTIWSATGLVGRYQLVTRIGASATRMRNRESAADQDDQEVVYRENIVVRLFKFVWRLVTLLFLFVWNTFLRILYIIEITILRAIILAYDIIYYITYAAWALAFYAVRISLAIIRWALRVAWKILRILTRLPLARSLWDKKLMPAIMGRWNGRMAERRAKAAKKLETKRRLVAAKGLDPDKWEADQKARHHFILPHPHDARKGLRGRIDERQKIDFNRRDRWEAIRKNKPLPPKLHSARRKRKLEEKNQRKEEEKAKRGDKGRSKERKGRASADEDEKQAADEEIAKAKPDKKSKPSAPKSGKPQAAPEE